MASKKKISETTPETTPEPETKPELTKAQKVALFERYSKANQALQDAKDKVASLTAARSEVVGEIAEKMGKGPFRYEGQELDVACRNGTYYFRSRGERETEDIG